MGEWRFLRGWSDREIAERLASLASAPSTGADAGVVAPDGYRHVFSEALVARDAGPRLPDGIFAHARELVTGYAFSDPAIVVAHFDREAPLLGRRMLLELRASGLRFLGGTVVAAVRDEHDDRRSVFGYRYDTLEGHIEAGSEWFLLMKEHASGDVRFRIESAWRGGQFPNQWSELGFRLVGRHYQHAWHRHAYLRLRAMLGSRGLPELPAQERLVHEGPRLDAPEAAHVAQKPLVALEVHDMQEEGAR